MFSKVLVVSTHPDDETLGAGGTIKAFREKGAQVFWLNATNVKTNYGYSAEVVEKRNAEIMEVNRAYGFERMVNLELQPTKLNGLAESALIDPLMSHIQEMKPDLVIGPHLGDAHSDHRAVFYALHAVTKIFRNPSVKAFLSMEALSETNFSIPGGEFKPNFYVDVSKWLDFKIAVMKKYPSEIKAHPFPRSEEAIRSLACLRGSEAGCQFAESFMVHKWVFS